MDILNLETGDIRIDPSFECHLGRKLFEKMKEYGDAIQQIDANTGVEETHESVRLRSIRVAQSLIARNRNIGDVVMIYSAFHTDACIPFLSSMYLGLVPICLSPGMTHSEMKHLLKYACPKILFVDAEMAKDIYTILIELDMDAEIVTFQQSYNNNFTPFSELSRATGTEESFKCRDFDPEKTTSFAVCSSGTTGMPKLVAYNHKAIAIQLLPFVSLQNVKNPNYNFVGYKALCFSPLVWISAIYSIMSSCIYGHTRIQNSGTYTTEVAKKALDKYQPHVIVMNPISMFAMAKYLEKENLKLESLICAYVGGSAINWDIVNDFQKFLPNGKIAAIYGSTETGSILVNKVDERNTLGLSLPWIKWKVVDIDTQEILGPNKTGELRIKSDQQFQKYWNDPESTKNAHDSDGYYKTGDLFYYDEDRNLYFVDRCKDVIKYMTHQISTIELEEVICKLPEVFAVGVVGLKNPKCGDIPMAFIQVVPGANLSAQSIKDIVKDNLSDFKQLRGGVVFLDKMPLTHSGKINRKALNELKHIVKGE